MRSTFPFPDGDRFFCVRQPLIDICDGYHCAAALLDALIRMSWDGASKPQGKGIWISKNASQWSEDLCGHYRESTIRGGFKTLLMKGYISKRMNPSNPFDRVAQYQIDFEEVIEALSKWKVGLDA